MAPVTQIGGVPVVSDGVVGVVPVVVFPVVVGPVAVEVLGGVVVVALELLGG